MLTTEWGPVGTRGGVEWMRGPGACPPGGNALQWGLRGAQRSHPNQDKHQAPSSLSLTLFWRREKQIGEAVNMGERREKNPMRSSDQAGQTNQCLEDDLNGCIGSIMETVAQASQGSFWQDARTSKENIGLFCDGNRAFRHGSAPAHDRAAERTWHQRGENAQY